MSQMAKCGRVRGWMADAVSGLLSESRRGEFETHIGGCAACRAEFQRVESLLGRIEESLSAELAVEPSARVVSSVRETIAAEPQRALFAAGWLTRNVWLSAAGVCAAMAVLLFILLPHRASRPLANFAPHAQITNCAREAIPARATAAPSRSASAENVPPGAPARAHSSKPRLAVARHELPRNPHPRRSEPEIIIQPGQMQALMQFVAASEKNQVNAVSVFDEMHRDSKPLVVEPLAITPLKVAALNADSAQDSPSGNARESRP